MRMNNYEKMVKMIYPQIHRSNPNWVIFHLVNKIKKDILGQNLADNIKNKRVLVAGCGGCAIEIIALSCFGPKEIIAIDLSKENIKYSKLKLKELKISCKNIKFHQQDILKLNSKYGKFEFIICNGVIHHTPSPQLCFNNLSQNIKNKGIFYLGIYSYSGILGNLFFLGPVFGKIIPYDFTRRIVSNIGLLNTSMGSVIDWFYSPIQKRYTYRAIRQCYLDKSFGKVVKLKSHRFIFNIPVISWILFGDNYLYVVGRKNSK